MSQHKLYAPSQQRNFEFVPVIKSYRSSTQSPPPIKEKVLNQRDYPVNKTRDTLQGQLKQNENNQKHHFTDFNSQLVKKQYIEIVREQPNLDKLKTHQEIVQEVFNTVESQNKGQLGRVRKHFKHRDNFDPLEATKLLRNEYLDDYFKGTYIEWGTRWYLEKIQTRTATNAILLLKKKLARGNSLGMKGGNSLIDRIITSNTLNSMQRDKSMKDVKIQHEKSLAKHVIAIMKEEESGNSPKPQSLQPQQVKNAEFFRQYCSKRKAYMNYKRSGLNRLSTQCDAQFRASTINSGQFSHAKHIKTEMKKSESPRMLPNQYPQISMKLSSSSNDGGSIHTFNQSITPQTIQKIQSMRTGRKTITIGTRDFSRQNQAQKETATNISEVSMLDTQNQLTLKLPPSMESRFTVRDFDTDSTTIQEVQKDELPNLNNKSRNQAYFSMVHPLTTKNQGNYHKKIQLLKLTEIHSNDKHSDHQQKQTIQTNMNDDIQRIVSPGNLASTLFKLHLNPQTMVKSSYASRGFSTSRNNALRLSNLTVDLGNIQNKRTLNSRPSNRLNLGIIEKKMQQNLNEQLKQQLKQKQQKIFSQCKDMMKEEIYSTNHQSSINDGDEILSSQYNSLKSSIVGSLVKEKKDLLPLKLYVENQNQEKFNRTLELLKELDQYEPHQLKQLYNYKLTGLMEEEQEARDVSYEYRLGMMDPSREAAMQEKQKANRKLAQINKNKTIATTKNIY